MGGMWKTAKAGSILVLEKTSSALAMPVAERADILSQQLELFERQSFLNQPPDDSHGCRELDSVIALGLTVFEQICRAERDMADQAAARRRQSDLPTAREIANLYSRWY
jgi:hypothetical protein